MSGIWRDLIYALRMLRRNPGFTAVAVLALALGIGANTAVFTVLNGVLLRPLPFPEPSRLFLVSFLPKTGPFLNSFGLLDSHYLEFRRSDRLFEGLTTFNAASLTLTGEGEPARFTAANVTSDFLSVLRVGPALGRGFQTGEEQSSHVVLIGDALWRSRFHTDPHVVGRNVLLDGVSYSVIGVMPAGFAFPYRAELWTPMAVRLNSHNSLIRPVVGRLKPGVTAEQARAELDTFVRHLPTGRGHHRSEATVSVPPLKEFLIGDARESLRIFAEAVAFVLLIACANVANLLLIRAAGRRQEIAVRSAMGAGRWRIIRQLLTESTVIALLGGTAGVMLAVWGVPILLAIAPVGKIPRAGEIHLDLWVLAFTAGVSLLTGILFGLAPALQAAKQDLRPALNQGARTFTRTHEGLRGALIVAEIALSLVLLTGAGLLLKSFLKMRAIDTGFQPGNLLTMTVDLPGAIYRHPEQMKAFHENTRAKLSAIPGAISAAAINWLPLGENQMTGDFQVEGGRFPDGFTVFKPSVSPGYFQVMGIRLISGREFTDSDNAAAPGVVVVSQSVARRIWPDEDPIGKRISMEDKPTAADWLTVVGVVADIRQSDLTKKPVAAAYQPYLQVSRPFFLDHMTFALRTAASPAAVAPGMRAALHEVDRDQPVQSLATMDDLIALTTAEPLFQARLLGVFAVLALALSAIGIYGVLAYSVRERTQEIGIRMALGAERSDVVTMVLRRTLLLAGAGVVLGSVGALAATRVLAKFLYAVKPTDPATFLSVALLLAAVALLAAVIPARRAAGVDPLEALRYE